MNNVAYLLQNMSIVYSGCKIDFSTPIYDEYEDGYLDNATEELAVCNNRLDHLEEDEGPKWDVSSFPSNLECQEEFISLDFIEDILCQMHEKNQVLNSGICNKIVDVSCTSCHENSLHDSFEYQVDSVQLGLQFEQLYWGKQMTKKIEDYSGFYDPVSEYMEQPCHGRLTTKIFEGCHDPVAPYLENICSGNGRLCVHSKD